MTPGRQRADSAGSYRPRRATVDGYDVDTTSVDAARRNAAESGVGDRVRFHVADAATGDARYDVVFAFECIHDLPDPVAVLATMRALAGDHGTVVVMDERVAETFTAPGDDIERLMYGYSLMCCLADGMAHQPSADTGTVMRPDTLRDYAVRAGSAGSRCSTSPTTSSASTVSPAPEAAAGLAQHRRMSENAAVFTVLGVPAHPLLVHAVVVLIPLSVLGAAALAFRPGWIRPYGPLVAAGSLAGAVTATLAKLAGDELQDAIDITAEFAPVIAQHGRFGLFTVVAAWPFAVLAVAATVLDRRAGGAAPRVVAGLAAVAGLGALVVTVLAGHSGAAAVWGRSRGDGRPGGPGRASAARTAQARCSTAAGSPFPCT